MKKMPIAVLSCLCVAVTLVLWGCGGGSGGGNGGGSAGSGSAAATTATIAVANNASAPMGFAFASPQTVKSGTSVTWQNQSSAPHSIVWDSQTPSTSPAPGAGIGTFGAGATSGVWTAPTVTANTTYAYHCGIHGPTMAGTVIVTP